MGRKIILFFLCIPFFLQAQNKAVVSGYVYNQFNEPVQNVIIKVQSSSATAKTDSLGFYSLALSAGNKIIYYRQLGYKTQTEAIAVLAGNKYNLNTTLIKEVRNLTEVKVEDKVSRNQNITKVDANLVSALPNASSNFESILKQLPGVSVNNELSSQYSVRGGNFDENLIYINDIEIYKPFLIRNGQQEGLSLINPDLVNVVKFSAGGFGARYGDKLSSVLDVQYKYADSNRFTVGIGTNGISATAISSGKNAFKYAFGFRQKQNKFILNSQPVVGTYNPEFYDFQAFLNYDLSKKLSIQGLGIYNTSRFGLIPESQSTDFGTLQQVLRLNVNYEGQEIDTYTNLVGAVTFNYRPNNNLNFKWINSAFFITEKENFDIYGSYIFEEINNDFGNSNFGKVEGTRGIGAYQNYGRNQLAADVLSSDLRFLLSKNKTTWEGGLRFQNDKINDRLKEFSFTDSAGFSVPNKEEELLLTETLEAENKLNIIKYSGFLENTSEFGKFSLTAGLRGFYNGFTKEFILSPRAVLSYRPQGKKDIIYRFSSGYYVQPPFYREMRNFNGILNEQAKSQKSIHFVGSSDYKFRALGTDLKFAAEGYFKVLQNLTPYKIDNLRIRYLANQVSEGYATGLDMRINGEFVNGLESTFRLSLMKTQEDILDDSYKIKDKDGNEFMVYPGYLNRPTDQRINFSTFFQDKLLNSPTYKVHINLLYGSKLPIGPPRTERYDDVFSIPSYKRVDIGFSKNLLDQNARYQPKFIKKYFSSFIIYAEIFNALNINNTVSYIWITDVDNVQYAIPNHLTSRQLNLRLIAKF